MATKAELEQQNKELKEALLSLKDKIQDLKSKKKGELLFETYIPFLDKENLFKKVKVAFNPFTGDARADIDSITSLDDKGRNDPAMAVYSSKIYLVEYVNSLIDQYQSNR